MITVIKGPPILQELLPNIIKILQKGNHTGPALRIIECYLLLGQLEALSEHMQVIIAMLERSIQKVLDYKETPQGPQFGRIGGKLASRQSQHFRISNVLPLPQNLIMLLWLEDLLWTI